LNRLVRCSRVWWPKRAGLSPMPSLCGIISGKCLDHTFGKSVMPSLWTEERFEFGFSSDSGLVIISF
jgi:hypothetical protein